MRCEATTWDSRTNKFHLLHWSRRYKKKHNHLLSCCWAFIPSLDFVRFHTEYTFLAYSIMNITQSTIPQMLKHTHIPMPQYCHHYEQWNEATLSEQGISSKKDQCALSKMLFQQNAQPVFVRLLKCIFLSLLSACIIRFVYTQYQSASNTFSPFLLLFFFLFGSSSCYVIQQHKFIQRGSSYTPYIRWNKNEAKFLMYAIRLETRGITWKNEYFQRHERIREDVFTNNLFRKDA